MEVVLYTLPECGICKMVKTKLNQKGIAFKEGDLAEVAESMGLDHAPVLCINKNENESEYIIAPSKIVDWINKQ